MFFSQATKNFRLENGDRAEITLHLQSVAAVSLLKAYRSSKISNDLSQNHTIARFPNTPRGFPAATNSIHANRGIPATIVAIPADCAGFPPPSIPHPRTDL